MSTTFRTAKDNGKKYPIEQLKRYGSYWYLPSHNADSIIAKHEKKYGDIFLKIDLQNHRNLDTITESYDLSYSQAITACLLQGYEIDIHGSVYKTASTDHFDHFLDELVELGQEQEEEEEQVIFDGADFEDNYEEYQVKKEESDLKRQLRQAMAEISTLKTQIEIASNAAKAYPKISKVSSAIADKKKSTAVLMLSDLHFGQVVDPAQVLSLGAFNSKLATERMTRLIRGAAQFIEERRHSCDVRDVVVLLGGDIIEGELGHKTLADLEVTEQVIFATEQLSKVLANLLDLGLNVRVQAVSGNHDRLPQYKRTPSDNRTVRSWDWLIYKQLKQRFSQSIKEFNISEGYIQTFDVHGKKCILHHGDNIKSGGGIGGIAPALMRWHHRQLSNFAFDISFMGHFHQPGLIDNWVVTNGSLPGISTYTLGLGLKNNKASQTLTWIHETHGLNGFHNLVLE